MKKFYVNERIFTIGDKYDVFDGDNNVAYNVHKQLFTFGKKFDIYNQTGSLVAHIEGKILRLLPEFDLYIGNKLIATITKRFTMFVSQYDIDSKDGSYSVDGNFLKWDFSISKNNKELCHVSKNFNFFADKYEITIHDEVDEILAISMVIIIDAIHHESKRR